MIKDPEVRNSKEALLMNHALEHDPQAIKLFLDNLSSANPQRCKILQESIHEFDDPLIWHHLLFFLANHRWDNQLFGYRISDHINLERIDQAIVEVFTQDETLDEKSIKDAVLHEALDNPEGHLQYAAAYILGLRHDPRSIPILGGIIDNGDRNWKLRAVKALSTLKEKACAQLLMKALVMDRSKLHREARRALQHLGPLAESVWLEALNHPESHIRWEAAHGLGQIGDARAAPTLAEGLFDESYVVRWATAHVLAQLGGRGVPATLTVLSKHEMGEPFRKAAYQALHGITSPQIGERIKPVLDAINNSSSKTTVSCVAQKVLLDWEMEKHDDLSGIQL
jgi:HEAT repeat protein